MSQTEVQLIKDAVIVNADVSNSAAIDVSKISGAMPTAGGTFTNDVIFTGTNANIQFDKTADAIEFLDNAEARFGTGDDLKIYHDGTSSILKNTTGGLFVQSDDTRIVNAANSETIARFIADGATELYHDGSKKLQTTANGIELPSNQSIFLGGKIDMTDSASTSTGRILLGTGDDLQIYHDGSNSYVQDSGTGALIIAGSAVNILNAAASESMIRASENGAVELYHNNVKKFETNSNGAKISGTTAAFLEIATTSGAHNPMFRGSNGDQTFDTGLRGDTNDAWCVYDVTNTDVRFMITTSGDVKIPNDSKKLSVGAGDDLEIFHDGTNNEIRSNGAKTINIRPKDTDVGIAVVPDGAVELYYDNGKKLETLSDGVNVTGTLKVNGSAFTGGKCIKQLATFTQNSFNTTDSAFSDVISVDYTPASSSSLIVFDFTAANSTVGNSSGGSATLGIRLMKDSTTLINATNATDFAVGNGEPDRISSSLLVRHMEGNSNTNQRTYKARFNREAGNVNATLSNGLGIIIREYAS